MLVDQNLELAFEFGLLCSVGGWHTRRHARHVLEHHQTEAVASPIEQVRLDFDLRWR